MRIRHLLAALVVGAILWMLILAPVVAVVR